LQQATDVGGADPNQRKNQMRTRWIVGLTVALLALERSGSVPTLAAYDKSI
jgi:hypothetical protein